MRAVPILFAAMLLPVACTAPPPGPPLATPPALPGRERCQQGAPVPAAPRPPRTVEQLGAWALKAEQAARQTERARAECAEDYARLRDWVRHQ